MSIADSIYKCVGEKKVYEIWLDKGYLIENSRDILEAIKLVHSL